MAKRDKGKHEAPKTCGYSWSTQPPDPQNPHNNHVCGLVRGHGGSRHVCRVWNCSESN